MEGKTDMEWWYLTLDFKVKFGKWNFANITAYYTPQSYFPYIMNMAGS